MSINGTICRRSVVKDGRAEATEVGAGDDEEEDDGDEAREVEDGGLVSGGKGFVRIWVERGSGGCLCVTYHA